MTGIILLFTAVASAISVVILSCVIVKKNKVIEQCKQSIKKNSDLYVMAIQWVETHQKGRSISKYLLDSGLHSVAVYGLGIAGIAMVEELLDSDLSIDYCIDKNATVDYMGLKVYKLSDNLPQVDAVIVTTISCYEDVKKEIMSKMNCMVLSLEDIVYLL